MCVCVCLVTRGRTPPAGWTGAGTQDPRFHRESITHSSVHPFHCVLGHDLRVAEIPLKSQDSHANCKCARNHSLTLLLACLAAFEGNLAKTSRQAALIQIALVSLTHASRKLR